MIQNLFGIPTVKILNWLELTKLNANDIKRSTILWATDIGLQIAKHRLFAMWVLLLWPVWLKATICEPTLLIITDRGLSRFKRKS